jgi:hypothetical protein
LLGTLTSTLSLTELVDLGESDEELHAPRSPPPEAPLEWLGLAVGELSFLSSSARLVDDLNWHSRAPNAVQMHLRIIDALSRQLAGSAALLHRGLGAYLKRQPAMGTLHEALEDVDVLSLALVEDHPLLSRRSEVLLGGYCSALAAGIQAAGQLSDAELAAVAGEPGPDPELVAAVGYDALTRALATLLGHARLNARDRTFVSSRMQA